MPKAIFLLLLFVHLSLESVEFVLFTQPKTATHLLIPILTDLTNKNVYWAPEYTKCAEPLTGSYEEASQNPECLPFNLNRAPWNRQMMDLIWETNQKKGTFLHLHAPYSASMENYLTEHNCINFFIKRDPRDQIVSLLNHYKYIHFNDEEVEHIPTDKERLLFMIMKESRAQTIHYMNWLNSPLCCVLDFEKLMGTHGGIATNAEALQEMKKIATVLQLDLSEYHLEIVYERHFGSGWSFFRGKVGVWKDYFNEEHKALIKEEIGDLLIQLGFEEDLDW